MFRPYSFFNLKKLYFYSVKDIPKWSIVPIFLWNPHFKNIWISFHHICGRIYSDVSRVLETPNRKNFPENYVHNKFSYRNCCRTRSLIPPPSPWKINSWSSFWVGHLKKILNMQKDRRNNTLFGDFCLISIPFICTYRM